MVSTKVVLVVVLAILAWCVDGRKDACSTGVNLRVQLKELQESVAAINATCDACQFAVTATRDFVTRTNATEKDIEKIIQVFCTIAKIEDPHVCQDIVQEYESLFFYLISDPTISSEYVCGIIDICPKPYFPGWNATLSPTPAPTPYPPPNPSNPSIYVLHVTDIHVDPVYTPGLTSQCGEPICCRPPNAATPPYAGKWGDYACDLPPALYENMLQWIAKNLPNVSYALFTGDMPPHDVWVVNRTAALAADSYIIDTWNQYLPNIKMFPAVGNHESVPVNEFAPRSVGGAWNMSWLYSGLAERWAQWLPSDALESVQFAGYYSTLSPDGVRIISLNTNLGCNNEDWFLAFPSNESADPDQMLHWFITTLDAAEQNKELVYIIKHIAPTIGNCGNDWYRNYLNIVDRYKNIILGDFAGHTHDDVFLGSYKLTSNTTVRPIITTFFAGSVTPYANENPGFRVLEIDSVTKAVIDYTEYYINLTETNIVGTPSWSVLYQARSAYSLADMSPSSWHQLSLNMGKNVTLLKEYQGRNGKDAFVDPCNEDCLHGTYCDLWNAPPDTKIDICGL